MNLTENALRDVLKQAYQLGCITPADEKEAVMTSLMQKAQDAAKEAFVPSKADQELRINIDRVTIKG